MKYEYSKITSLISRIHSLASDFLRTQLESKKLPEFVSSHGNILYQLSQVDRLTMTELSQKINRDKSTTTVLVRRLIREGFVTRDKSSADNRVVYIKLSPQGFDYAKATSQISNTLNETCYKGFSETDKKAVYSLLLRIESNFTDALN